MNKKFCTSCQREKEIEGGKMIMSLSNIKRWKCASCLASKSNGLYTSKKATK